MKQCLLFPGQGIQYKGMGASLLEKYPDEIEIADSVLEYSIKELCLNDKKGLLKNTQYSQPAILFINYLHFLEFTEKGECTPDYVMGHSLGEYSALLAAGVMNLQTALRVVQKRGELMASATSGAMAAVLNLDINTLQDLVNASEGVEIANINTPKQIVISGENSKVHDLREAVSGLGGVFIPLAVSGAFHSSFMKNAAKEFSLFIDTVTFNEPRVPIISNVTAQPHEYKKLKSRLVEQIYSKVRWVESVQYVESKGITTYVELGPKNILTKMVDEIKTYPLPNKESEVTAKETNNTHEYTKLGAKTFLCRYNLSGPLMAGGMYKGVASKEMVIAMAEAGFLASLGAGGLAEDSVQGDIQFIQKRISNKFFAVNFLANHENPIKEKSFVKMLLENNVSLIEAAAFIDVSEALALFKIKGLVKSGDKVVSKNRIIAKVSHPKVAENFLSPIPTDIVQSLVESGDITANEASLSKGVVLADDITIEADSGGHTDQGITSVLLPTIRRLRDTCMKQYNIQEPIHVGLAGGIGTPEAALAAFILGADYIVTGSINQCTKESGQSGFVKDILSTMSVNDTAYAPAGDMFEMGAKVQVLKKGVLFPMRALKLFELYRQYDSIEDIPQNIKNGLEKSTFGKTINEVYEECRQYHPEETIQKAETNPKFKMALIFKWYYGYASSLALNGVESGKVNFQVHCGSSLGAFNTWIKGTEFESWKNRDIVKISKLLLSETERCYESVI